MKVWIVVVEQRGVKHNSGVFSTKLAAEKYAKSWITDKASVEEWFIV